MAEIRNYLDRIRPEWTPGSVDPREGEFLYWLIRNFQPLRIVEIGHSTGYSTLWLAAAVEDNGTGAIVTIDMDLEPACAKRFDQHMIASGANRYVRKVKADSVEAEQRMIWDVAGFHGFYDFLFLDGDHTPGPVEQDLIHWLPHMSPHGILVAHDTVKFFEDEIAQRLRDYKSEYFERAWPGSVIRRLIDQHEIEDYVAMTLDTSHGMTMIRRRQTT